MSVRGQYGEVGNIGLLGGPNRISAFILPPVISLNSMRFYIVNLNWFFYIEFADDIGNLFFLK